MASKTILSTEFNGRNVTISQPKAVEIEKDGKKQVVGKKAFVNYNGERLALQSATEMRVPFGLSVFKAEGGGQDKYSINLSFNGYQQAGEVKAFYDAVRALDAEVVNQAVKNSKAWFGKEKSREVLEEFYTPSVKFGKDTTKDYPPTMKLNLRRNGDSFETKFYDINGKKFTGLPAEEMLAKGTLITALIECSDVWIAGTGKFNLRWNVTQIIIHKLPERGAEFAFKLPASNSSSSAAATDSYDDYAATSNVVDDEEDAAVTSASVVAAVLPSAAADDDDDDDDEEAPPPPKKAPTVTKKKPVVAAKPRA
jgi:Family of unknown function (DUF5871)